MPWLDLTYQLVLSRAKNSVFITDVRQVPRTLVSEKNSQLRYLEKELKCYAKALAVLESIFESKPIFM